MKRWIFLALAGYAMAASLCVAQDESAARIVAEGENTTMYPVARLAFRFDAIVDPVADITEATRKLSASKLQLEKLLRNSDNGPLTAEVGPLVIEPPQSPAGWSAWLRFAPPTAKPGNTAEEQLGGFLRRVNSVAAQAGCTVHGPYFEAAESELHEQETIGKATEQALYKAEAVARALRTRIYTVERVEIVELEWTRSGAVKPADDKPSASLNGVPCTARVKITYLSAPF